MATKEMDAEEIVKALESSDEEVADIEIGESYFDEDIETVEINDNNKDGENKKRKGSNKMQGIKQVK